jgi:hypothetical protein
MADLRIRRSPNLDAAMRMLTDGTFSKMTGRKVKALSIPQAAAFLGNVVHETGSADLSDLDVVERGNGGAGRGMSQYTGDRRQAYDKAMRGKNANNINTQLQYAAEEYAGKHDPAPGKSLVGYTKALEDVPKELRGAVEQLLQDYFRPRDPAASREARYRNAQQIEQLYAPRPNVQPAPKPQQPKKENRTSLSIFAASAPSLLRF